MTLTELNRINELLSKWEMDKLKEDFVVKKIELMEALMLCMKDVLERNNNNEPNS